MTDGKHIPQEDLALYAMQSLPAEERARVHEHLGACAECRDEFARVSGDLALIALSAEQKPLPEGARGRFMARIAADARDVAGAALGPGTAAPSGRARIVLRWLMGIGWAAAAVSIVVATALHTRIRSLNGRLQQKTAMVEQMEGANARAQAILNLLTAPAAKHVVLTAAKSRPAPTARAVYLAAEGALLMQASNLNSVPAGKTYELWVIPTKGAPIPAGLFRPDAAGNASVVLPSIPKGVEAKAFGVTVEKSGGSSTPTAPIVLEGAVPASGE
jgi:Anti-sigma-K factor rskA, C-terminal/Putative zinc-finger